MNDAKNILLAWFSAGSPLVAVAASETGLTIISAVVLPVLLFTLGKTVDVILQIYLKRRVLCKCRPRVSCREDEDADTAG